MLMMIVEMVQMKQSQYVHKLIVIVTHDSDVIMGSVFQDGELVIKSIIVGMPLMKIRMVYVSLICKL